MNYGGIGMDKFAHMGIGGMMAAVVMIVTTIAMGSYGWVLTLYPFIAHIVVFVISCLKERYLDDKYEWVDIWYAMAGSAVIHLAYIVGYAISAIK